VEALQQGACYKFLLLLKLRLRSYLSKKVLCFLIITSALVVSIMQLYLPLAHYQPPSKWSYLVENRYDFVSDSKVLDLLEYLSENERLQEKYLFRQDYKDRRITPARYLRHLRSHINKTGGFVSESLQYGFSWQDWVNFDERLLPNMHYLLTHNGLPISGCSQFETEIGFPPDNHFKRDSLPNCTDLMPTEISRLANPNYPHFRATAPLDNFQLPIEARIVHGATFLYHHQPPPQRLIFVDGLSKTDFIVPVVHKGQVFPTDNEDLNDLEPVAELYSNITKAFDSLSHLNDSNVDVLSKDLLLSYINNLIGILDNLVMELNLETINGSLIPQLVGSNVLNGLFSLFNFETTSKFNISLSLSVLQFVYDLSSISENFLKDVLLNNTEFKDVFEKLLSNSGTIFGKTPLGRIYLVGIKLQILEIQDDLTSNLDSTLGEIFNILTEIDFNSEKDDEFQIVDISLDLLTTIIEIKGSLLLEDSSNKDKVFISQCTDNILPFLGKLFEVNFKNNKKLICLNNLIIYLKSNNCVNEKLLSDLENLNSNKIANDFTTLLQSSDKSDLDLELLVDFLNFKLNLLEIDPSKFASEETQVNALIELGMKMSSIDVAIDSELQLQFITSLLIYLSLLAKCIENIETTKAIVNFIIRYNITIPFSFYNTQLKSGLNISKFHHKYHYFVEETVTLAINSIFEMFDDDYPYNRPIYHGENLNEILISVLGDYKKLYKNIDKNLNLRLKKQTEETLNNLQRFIEYKKTE